MAIRKIYVHDIGDYDRDPNVYHKRDYSPFGRDSLTWITYYFKIITKRKKMRVFQSFGRSKQEAIRGLEVATRKSGFLTISKQTYLKNKGRRDDE